MAKLAEEVEFVNYKLPVGMCRTVPKVLHRDFLQELEQVWGKMG